VPSTATTYGARAHARAQAGRRVPAMPTVPAGDATGLPAGVDPGSLTWDETVASGGYATRLLARGTTVRLEDVDGTACAHLLVFRADRPTERLNVADTVKVQWQAYLEAGSVLLSGLGRALATIVADGSGVHDTVAAGGGRGVGEARWGDRSPWGPAPSAHDRFVVACAKHGLDRRHVHPAVALFKGCRIEPDGALTWRTDGVRPGAAVELLAELPLLLVVANVPHALDPAPAVPEGLLRLSAWPGTPTSSADERWSSTPERRRAYESTADDLASATSRP
jgi:uncharacterized protein